MEAYSFISGDTFKIYIEGGLHLAVRDRILAVQSWKEENNWWKLNIHTKDKTILLEYDSESRWRTILNLLDKHL